MSYYWLLCLIPIAILILLLASRGSFYRQLYKLSVEESKKMENLAYDDGYEKGKRDGRLEWENKLRYQDIPKDLER